MTANENQPARLILVADDEGEIRDVLRTMFEGAGYRVIEAATLDEALVKLKQHKIDLMTLDLNFGPRDGLELARQFKSLSNAAIIMITGRAEDVDKIVGLELGADDYIVKPFVIREVLARVRAVLRRTDNHSANLACPSETYAFGDFVVDQSARELRRRSGELIALTAAEFRLLEVFASRPRRVLRREQLLDLTSGFENDTLAFDRSIDTLVSRLRRKLQGDPGKPSPIRTVRGVGYMLDMTG